MPLIKLFKQGPEEIDKERPLALSLLETEMSTFTLDPKIKVEQVNGPYVISIPPEKEGLPKRVYFTANIIYHQK